MVSPNPRQLSLNHWEAFGNVSLCFHSFVISWVRIGWQRPNNRRKGRVGNGRGNMLIKKSIESFRNWHEDSRQQADSRTPKNLRAVGRIRALARILSMTTMLNTISMIEADNRASTDAILQFVYPFVARIPAILDSFPTFLNLRFCSNTRLWFFSWWHNDLSYPHFSNHVFSILHDDWFRGGEWRRFCFRFV